MKYTYNNDQHNLPQFIDCECSFSKRLEASENTKGEVKYYYKCQYSKCLKEVKVEDIQDVD